MDTDAEKRLHLAWRNKKRLDRLQEGLERFMGLSPGGLAGRIVNDVLDEVRQKMAGLDIGFDCHMWLEYGDRFPHGPAGSP